MQNCIIFFFIGKLPTEINFFIHENVYNTIFWSLLPEPKKGDFQQLRGRDYVYFFLVRSTANNARMPLSLQTIVTSPLIKNFGCPNAAGNRGELYFYITLYHTC